MQQSAQRRPQPNNGKRGATKRKQSELTPGAREIEQEAAARETQRMLQHFAVSNVVEVRGTEDGFLGSWYAARVLEAREARSNVKLRLCYEAFQEDDGSNPNPNPNPSPNPSPSPSPNPSPNPNPNPNHLVDRHRRREAHARLGRCGGVRAA